MYCDQKSWSFIVSTYLFVNNRINNVKSLHFVSTLDSLYSISELQANLRRSFWTKLGYFWRHSSCKTPKRPAVRTPSLFLGPDKVLKCVKKKALSPRTLTYYIMRRKSRNIPEDSVLRSSKQSLTFTAIVMLILHSIKCDFKAFYGENGEQRRKKSPFGWKCLFIWIWHLTASLFCLWNSVVGCQRELHYYLSSYVPSF